MPTLRKITVADDSSTSKYGGTGLGLGAQQKLCKLMAARFSSRASSEGSAYDPVPLLTGRRKGYMASVTLVPAASDFALEQPVLNPACEIMRSTDMLTGAAGHGFPVCAHDGPRALRWPRARCGSDLMDSALGEMAWSDQRSSDLQHPQSRSSALTAHRWPAIATRASRLDGPIDTNP